MSSFSPATPEMSVSDGCTAAVMMPPPATGQHALVSTAGDQASDAASQGPIPPSQRIEGIDVLRGLALFGVMAINVVFEFRVDFFEQFLPPSGSLPAADRTLKQFLVAAVELKAFALFS